MLVHRDKEISINVSITHLVCYASNIVSNTNILTKAQQKTKKKLTQRTQSLFLKRTKYLICVLTMGNPAIHGIYSFPRSITEDFSNVNHVRKMIVACDCDFQTRFWHGPRFFVTKYSNFETRWKVSNQSEGQILWRATRWDTVAMFLLRNDQETVIIVNTSESSCSNSGISGIILGLQKV